MSCDFKMVLAEIPPSEDPTPVAWEDQVGTAAEVVYEVMEKVSQP